MDYLTAKEILKTSIVTSFSKTQFRNVELRRKALLWAINLPSGRSLDSQIETTYHVTYAGSMIKFGKPGKEVFRIRNPNKFDMTPILYEKRHGELERSAKGFNFFEMLKDIQTKIVRDEEAGHILLATLYRCGVLADHAISDDKLCYNPNIHIMQWLDDRLGKVGEFPPSELIPMYDAIMLNDDIKIYTNPSRYQSGHLEPYGPKGRINTMGAIFAICAPDDLLSRVELSSLLITGRGTPRIFSKTYEYGRPLISKMTGGIIDHQNDQMRLL
jgi:hypothetical protein